MTTALINWLRNWTHNVRELVIVAGTLGSGFTTFTGAYRLVNANLIVAGMLTIFFQGGLYIIGHHAVDSRNEQRRPRTFALSFAWMLLVIFSVYTSSLGMFELVKDSLKHDHASAVIAEQWRLAAEQVADFRTNALAILNRSKQQVSLDLAIEKNRERAARAARLSHSPVSRQRLLARLEALNNAERRTSQVPILSGTPPLSREEATAAMDDAFALVGDAIATLPDDVKAQCVAPERSFTPSVPEDLQQSFWNEIRSRSAPALVIVAFAFLLDFLPLMVRWASRPKAPLAERIVRARYSVRNVWVAARQPLSAPIESLNVRADHHPDIEVILEFSGTPYLAHIARGIEVLTEAMSARQNRQMKFVRAMSTSGREVVADLPLVSQLQIDRTVLLQFEGKEKEESDGRTSRIN